MTVSGALIGHRYQLVNLLDTGSMGMVYRALDRLTQTAVALKRVMPPGQRGASSRATPLIDTDAFNLSLAHEFETLAALHHPHIITVLDYGFDSDGPYFTMEYLEGAQTITGFGRDQPLMRRVELLLQMLQALAYLHRHHILHRDLKPANILVMDGQVQVLDFGLSVARGLTREIAGTLAYIAPEALKSEPITEASDLYAVGVIAYELFAGEHPFPTRDTSELIRSTLTLAPDLAKLDFYELPGAITGPALPRDFGERMAAIIGRLLVKDPADRYPRADAVIAALGQAAARPDLLQESGAVRESLLQAARFVGREAERAQLMEALAAALEGWGSVWLIGGESGIGKSRLIDELRIPALVRGALTLEGQASSDGGMPHQLWRDPVRRLALSTPLSDLDASVLKSVAPDMDRLIGRAVPDAPALDGPGAQQRLALTIADLFRQQSQPVVLLLDDLHWAGESLLPLRELTRLAPQLPLLVVGTYRDDERPDLPADLPGARALTLERLSEDQIRTLSVSALGEAGATPRIVEFLKSETEGNAFFMVETLRALAEEAGQLSAIPQMDLPERMFPKGAQAVAQRRLDRLPIDYHPLLRVAAVAGRQIDLDLLRQIDPFVNLDRWLLACAEAGMITRDEGLWRFAHEKLRDGILFGLAEDQQPKLNRMVAEAMEAIHAEPEVYARALCDHWRRAGDPLKTVYYARHAAHQLMGISEYQGAVKLAERALDGLPDADMSDDALALRVLRAELLYTVGQYAEARQELEDTLPIARHGRHTHCVLTGVRIMGHVMQALGEYAEARRWMTESLDLARAVGNRPGEAQALRNLGLIAENLGELDLATDLYRHSLDLFRAVEDRMGTAGALANLGSVAVYRGQHDDAQARFDDALAIFQAIGYRWGIAYTLIRLGDVALRTGAYDEARAALEQALALCDEIGHRWGMAFAQIQLGHVSLAQRQYRQAGGCFYRALRAAWDIQAVPTALDALVGVAQFLQIDEDFERAVELLALALAHPSTDMETKTRATQALDALAGELAPDTLDSATAQGRVRDLAGVVGGLLDESAAMGWGA